MGDIKLFKKFHQSLAGESLDNCGKTDYVPDFGELKHNANPLPFINLDNGIFRGKLKLLNC